MKFTLLFFVISIFAWATGDPELNKISKEQLKHESKIIDRYIKAQRKLTKAGIEAGLALDQVEGWCKFIGRTMGDLPTGLPGCVKPEVHPPATNPIH